MPNKRRGRPAGSKNKSRAKEIYKDATKLNKKISPPKTWGKKDFEAFDRFIMSNGDKVVANVLVENPQSPKIALIRASLKVSGRTCTAEGSTVQEAITNLKPEIARGTGILTLEKKELRKEKIIPHNLIIRLFGKVSNFNKEIALKNVMLMFDKSLFE